MAHKVVVIGSCMTDLVCYAPRLPNTGETLVGHKFSIGFGGKGANQCIAAARLGAVTAMVAKVGDDSFGSNYLQNFRDNNIDTTHVGTTSEAGTGVAPITVNDQGENSIIIVGGANLLLSIEDVDAAEELIKEASIVVCQGEIRQDVTAYVLAKARKYGVKTLMNAAPAASDLDSGIFTNSDIFCVNETEAEILTGAVVESIADAKQAAEVLLSRGCGCIILTLGGEGALYSTRDKHKHIFTEKVTPVDTTGAGDAFIGSLSYYVAYMPELNLDDVIERCCKIATVSVLAPGTQASYPHREQLPQQLFKC